jgi:hypothetical protein
VTYGYEVRDALGSLTSTSARLGRILGVLAVPASGSTSASFPDFVQANGFFYWVRSNAPTDTTSSASPDLSWDDSTKTLTATSRGAPGNVYVGMNK